MVTDLEREEVVFNYLVLNLSVLVRDEREKRGCAETEIRVL